MRRCTLVAWGTVLLAVLASGTDAEERRDLAAETHALRTALPAPSQAARFTFDGYVLRAGAPYGRVTLSARAQEGGRWSVRDAIVPVDPAGDRVLAAALLDRSLAVQEMTYTRRNARGFLHGDVKREASAGYRVLHETNDYVNRLEIDGQDAVATLSAIVLFLRLLPAGPGLYELPDLDPNPAPGDPYLAPARVEVHRQAPWRVRGTTRRAWIASYTRGTQTLRFALDAEDRSLLGVDFVGLPFQFVPSGSGPVGLVDGVAADLMTPIEQAVARTRALRARLPAPHEAGALDFRGQVRLGAARVGTIWLRAEPTSLGGQPAWAVLESQVLATGASRVEMESTGVLAADLTLRRGGRVDKRPAGTGQLTYERARGGMRLVSRAQGRSTSTLLAAAPDASAGLVPVILMLKHAPATPAHYLLSGWDARFAGKPKAGSGSFAFQAADTHVQVLGEGPFVLDGARRPTLRADCTLRSGRRYTVHLDPRTRDLVAVVGTMPKTMYVAADAPGAAPDWYDAIEGKPATARQAFVKFGRGYHRPREDLLADAFHWPSLHAQALARERYPPGTAIDRIRKDWIDTFVGMSKHRTQGDCDDLLFQILMTSREVTHEDGSVSLHTLPVYGGHTYRMAERDGRWFIVAID